MRTLIVLSMLILQPVFGVAQTFSKAGAEFRVNTYTTGFQSSPAIAVGRRDRFVVTWGSAGSNGSDLGASIQAQQFNGDGSRRGAEFQVNSYTTSWQLWPAVAMTDINEFVIVWASLGSYGSDDDWFSIQGQKFNAAGTASGSQFQVSTYSTDWQLLPEITSGGGNGFVVSWDSFGSAGSDNDGYSVQGQRLGSAADLAGPEFQVNTYTTRRQYYPAVAADEQGNFIVVWESQGSFGDDQFTPSVQGQRFAATGAPIGGEFQINTYTTGSQRSPSVAMSTSGEFVVVWESNADSENGGQGYAVAGQSFDANGLSIGAEFQVHADTTISNRWPAVAADSDGSFAVAWGRYDYNAQYPRGDIFIRRISADGTMIGKEFQTSTYVNGFKSIPAIVAQKHGFVVVWRTEYGFGPLEVEVKGQRVSLAAADSTIFADGFESGNTVAWDQ